MTIPEFQTIVWRYYDDNARVLPWRQDFSPYRVFVSELMLQQTQVNRVIVKFEEFLSVFPTVEVLANAPFSEVLRAWSGLGYNRRAQFLHRAAQMITNELSENFPHTVEELKRLPGVGHNTAAAIVAYAYNQPTAFIETNIRSVYIHHFFSDKSDVDDKEIMPLIEASAPQDNPREWYWALMDYGTYLKSQHQNPSRKSKHHKSQSKFEGSDRQIRGKILSTLLKGPLKEEVLHGIIADDRSVLLLKKLQAEKLVTVKNGLVGL